MTRFEGKVALVTGSASGIGLAIVRRLLDEGALVAGLDLADQSRLAQELGARFLAVRCDVTDEDSVETAVARAVSGHGRLDVAFNAAGASRGAPIMDMDRAEWAFTVDLVLTGVFLSTKHEARTMVGHGGAIINIGSINGRIPMFAGSAYVSAKAGVEAFTRNAAVELARHGVRVNCVLPGLVETPLTAGFRANPAVLEALTARILLGRAAVPDEIADPALYLASDGASYVTGAALMVDGGWEAGTYPDLSSLLPELNGHGGG